MIGAIKNGEEQVFEQAYVLYRGKLFAYFLKKSGSEEDAKDLLQITFCRLWQYRKSLCEEYTLEQHLFHIARTVFIDYLRKENKLKKVKALAESNSQVQQQEDHSHEFDLNSLLQTKLSAMPFLRKRVFELNKIEGYSYKEIAKMLSIPVKAVDNNLTKALKFLRNTGLIFIIILANIFP